MRKARLTRNIVVPRQLDIFGESVLRDVQKMGGFSNAHAHWDRARTLPDEYLRHIGTTPLDASSAPLEVKQDLVGAFHDGMAFTEKDLRVRMSQVIENQIAYGVTRFVSCIDVTPDIKERGMLAFRVAQELKEKYATRIKIEIGPMPIFGFKEGTQRWKVFARAAKQADFLVGLPEKDEHSDPVKHAGRITFRGHLRRILELAMELNKEVHVHVDQANNPNEHGTETLIEGLKWLDPFRKGPMVWAIHMISPNGYGEARRRQLLDDLMEYKVGVIVCPTAAVSMRQLRPILAPSHSAIAPILELCACRIPVQLGTDNINDVFIPQGDGDLLTEVRVAGHAVRYASPTFWAKLASGTPLNNVDRAAIKKALQDDLFVYQSIEPNWVPAVAC